jgi:hypothetical protein
MQGEEFEVFCQDVKDNGLIEAIWLHPDGRIIDGRNRHRACQEVGVEPSFRTWDGKGSLVDFVLSLNLHRRHLTSGQQGAIGTLLEEKYSIENKSKVGGRPITRTSITGGNIATSNAKTDKVNSRDQAAKMIGISPRNIQESKRIKRDAPKVFEKMLTGEIPTVAEAKRQAFETDSPNIKQPMQLLVSHKELEYYTPSEYIETARDVMGHIDLDPASSEIANEVVKAKAIFSQDDNGLNKKWTGKVWLNPPYSKSQGKSNQELWANKLIDEYRIGNVNEAILLSKAAFGYKWFEILFKSWPVCLVTERISFNKIDGTTDGPAKHSTAFFYFGDNTERFIKEFRRWGCVIDQKNGIVYPKGEGDKSNE